MHALIFISLSSSPPMAIFLLLILLSFTRLPFFPKVEAATSTRGFSVELIRRGSPKSPFSSAAAVSPKTSRSTLAPENGEFLMKLSIGTPPRNVFAILDTGSDLFWAQCLPCASCYKQIAPVFDPSRSSTFRRVSCRSERCRWVVSEPCTAEESCRYSYGYQTGLTEGNLATETVTLASKSGETVSFRDVVFGCGHNNSGTFNANEMGLIGLGRGNASFISQVGPSIGGRKFSHCLPPFNTNPQISTTIAFGSGSEVTGAGAIKIPLFPSPDLSGYFLTLTGITVGKTFIPYTSAGPAPNGNVVLDSGTPTTLLPQDFYDRVAAAVKRRIRAAPSSGGGGLCYGGGKRFEAPPMSLRFGGGGDVALSAVQTFVEMEDGLFCFAMEGYSDRIGIIGNFVQANFLIGFDVEEMTVSFKPTDCTKLG